MINKCIDEMKSIIEPLFSNGAFFYSLLLGGFISFFASMIVSECSSIAIILMLLSVILMALLSYFTKAKDDRFQIGKENYDYWEQEQRPELKQKQSDDRSLRTLDKINKKSKKILFLTDKSYDWFCFFLLVSAFVTFSLSIYYVKNEQDDNKRDFFYKVETFEQKIDSIITVQQGIEKDIESNSITQDSILNEFFSKMTKMLRGQIRNIKER